MVSVFVNSYWSVCGSDGWLITSTAFIQICMIQIYKVKLMHSQVDIIFECSLVHYDYTTQMTEGLHWGYTNSFPFICYMFLQRWRVINTFNIISVTDLYSKFLSMVCQMVLLRCQMLVAFINITPLEITYRREILSKVGYGPS